MIDSEGQNVWRRSGCLCVDLVMKNLLATERRIEEIRKAQEADEVCRTIIRYSKEGWPTRNHVKGRVKPYLSVASELVVHGGILVRGNQIVIPASLHPEMLGRLHCGNQGMSKCRQRV